MASAADPQLVLRTLCDGALSLFSRPFSRFGVVPIGGRTAAVKLRQGDVWVMVGTPLDSATRDRLKEMGEVKYLVAPDAVHHLFIGDYSKEFPEAAVIGVEGLPDKRPEVKWTGIYEKDPQPRFGFEDEISARYFPSFGNKDVAFCHHDSKTLMVADLLFNLPATEQYSKAGGVPLLARLGSYLKPSSSLHKSFLWAQGAGGALPDVPKGGSPDERRARFKADAEAVAAWDFERIVMCHGDVIEGSQGEAKKAWNEAFAKYFKP